MRFNPCKIPGCWVVNCQVFPDSRGRLIKTFQRSDLSRLDPHLSFKESFFTVSGASVLRGMHIQLPPDDHVKLVCCLEGRVLDVWLDMRRGSQTYGESERAALAIGDGVLLPRGVAHGFCVLEAPAMLAYHVTSEHVPIHDAGVHWNSFGVDWPIRAPLVSARDSALPAWKDFDSPFRYDLSVGAEGAPS